VQKTSFFKKGYKQRNSFQECEEDLLLEVPKNFCNKTEQHLIKPLHETGKVFVKLCQKLIRGGQTTKNGQLGKK